MVRYLRVGLVRLPQRFQTHHSLKQIHQDGIKTEKTFPSSYSDSKFEPNPETLLTQPFVQQNGSKSEETELDSVSDYRTNEALDYLNNGASCEILSEKQFPDNCHSDTDFPGQLSSEPRIHCTSNNLNSTEGQNSDSENLYKTDGARDKEKQLSKNSLKSHINGKTTKMYNGLQEKRRPKIHRSNSKAKKGHNSNKDSDFWDSSVPYKSYKLAYIPGRQNVIKVIRRGYPKDLKTQSSSNKSSSDKKSNALSRSMFTEQIKEDVDRKSVNMHGVTDQSKSTENNTNSSTDNVNICLDLSLREKEIDKEGKHTDSDSSESSLLVDYPLPSEEQRNMKNLPEENDNEDTDGFCEEDSNDKPTYEINGLESAEGLPYKLKTRLVLPRGAVIRGKPLNRRRSCSRKSQGLSKSSPVLDSTGGTENWASGFSSDTTGQKRKYRSLSGGSKRQRMETEDVTWEQRSYSDGAADMIRESTKSDVDLNHNVTKTKGMDSPIKKKKRTERRIRSVTLGAGLKLPIIKPRVRQKRSKARSKSAEHSIETKWKPRVNSFDYISPIVEQVWADMSKKAPKLDTPPSPPNNTVSDTLMSVGKPEMQMSLEAAGIKNVKSILTYSTVNGVTENVKADNNQSTTVERTESTDTENLGIEDNDESLKYNGTLSPGALGERPVLKTPPISVSLNDSYIQTSMQNVHLAPSKAPEPTLCTVTSTTVPVVPSTANASVVSQNSSPIPPKPSSTHVLVSHESKAPSVDEHSHYTVVAKSDTVINISRSPTLPKPIPELIPDKPNASVQDQDQNHVSFGPENKKPQTDPPVLVPISPPSSVTEDKTESTVDNSENVDKGAENMEVVEDVTIISDQESNDGMDCAESPSTQDIEPEETTPLTKVGDQNATKSPNVVYLHLNSSELTNAKTKLLVEELDMLIARRELELQSLYSRRARALKRLNTPQKKPKSATLKTIEIDTDKTETVKPKIKPAINIGILNPPPAHSSSTRKQPPSTYTNGKVPNIKVIKWSKNEQSNKPKNKQIPKRREDSEKGTIDTNAKTANQTVSIAGKAVQVIKPTTTVESTQSVSTQPVVPPVAVTSHSIPKVNLAAVAPRMTTSSSETKKSEANSVSPEKETTVTQGNKSKPMHSERLKEIIVQQHLNEATKRLLNAATSKAAALNNSAPVHNQPSSQELYALVSRPRQGNQEIQKVEAINAQGHPVTIEKVLNKLEAGEIVRTVVPGMNNENTSMALAALSSLSQGTINTGFSGVMTANQEPNTLSVQTNVPQYSQTGYQRSTLQYRGPVSVPQMVSPPMPNPQNNVQQFVNRFPQPQMQVPPGIPRLPSQMTFVRQRSPPVRQAVPFPVPQLSHGGQINNTAAQNLAIINNHIESLISPINPEKPEQMSEKRVDPNQIIKNINHQVSRMQKQLVESNRIMKAGGKPNPIATTDHIEIASNENMASSSVCSLCRKQALFLCAACQKIWYCSKECQVKAWPSHQNACIYQQNSAG